MFSKYMFIVISCLSVTISAMDRYKNRHSSELIRAKEAYMLATYINNNIMPCHHQIRHQRFNKQAAQPRIAVAISDNAKAKVDNSIAKAKL